MYTYTHTDSVILGGTLGSLSITLMSIVVLLLGIILIKKFRKNTDRRTDSAVAMITKHKNQSIPYIISAGATAAATEINCQPNVAHELTLSLNTEYLYIIPD